MQEPTHILAGALIQKTFAGRMPRPVALGLTAGLAFLSHGFLDKLSNLTYHPAEADFKSVFWVSYHVMILALTILFLCIYWRPCKWGVFFSMMPDLDWVFIHGQKIFHLHLAFYQQPHLHLLLRWIYKKIPLFDWMDHLPNFRLNPWACLWEAVLVAVLLLAIRWIKPKGKI